MRIDVQLSPDQVLERAQTWLRSSEARPDEPTGPEGPIYGGVRGNEFWAERVFFPRSNLHGSLRVRVVEGAYGSTLVIRRLGIAWVVVAALGAVALGSMGWFHLSQPGVEDRYAQALTIMLGLTIVLILIPAAGIVRDWRILMSGLRARFQDAMAPSASYQVR